MVYPEAGAKCLDGSIPAFYWKKGDESKKFLIYFEGGEFCGSFTYDMTM